MLETRSLSYVKYIKISKLNNFIFEDFFVIILHHFIKKKSFKIIFDLSNIERL